MEKDPPIYDGRVVERPLDHQEYPVTVSQPGYPVNNVLGYTPQNQPVQVPLQAIPGQFYILDGQTCIYTVEGRFVPVASQPAVNQYQPRLNNNNNTQNVYHFQNDINLAFGNLALFWGIQPWKVLLGFSIFSIIFVGLFLGLFLGLTA